MEEILRKLQKEASGSKHRAIKESCTWAIETLDSPDATTKIPPYQLREKCLLPLQLALESKSVKLAQQALAGMQKLLSDERFVSVETDSDEKQLLNQMLNAVKVTPSLNEDLQVEVMKSQTKLCHVISARQFGLPRFHKKCTTNETNFQARTRIITSIKLIFLM